MGFYKLIKNTVANRWPGGLPEFLQDNVVGGQQGGGNTVPGDPAGGAAGLEIGGFHILTAGDIEYLVGAINKGTGKVPAVVNAEDLGTSGQHIGALAADYLGRRARGGQAAKLFGAERNPVDITKFFEAVRAADYPAVIAAGQPRQAGADNDQFFVRVLHSSVVCG
jgi:hypothetical protein